MAGFYHDSVSLLRPLHSIRGPVHPNPHAHRLDAPSKEIHIPVQGTFLRPCAGVRFDIGRGALQLRVNGNVG